MSECTINTCFHQTCDKSTATGVKAIEWSPASDLAAVITIDGEVRLHRLYWQKVWAFQEKEAPASCIAWHPKGKTLAVGCENGDIKLLELEKGALLTSIQLSAAVLSLDWLPLKNSNQVTADHMESSDEYVKSLVNLAGECQNQSSQIKDKLPEFLQETETPSLLFVGKLDGTVTLLLNGLLKLARISISKSSPDYDFFVHSACMSVEQSTVSIVTAAKCSDNRIENFTMTLFTSSLLSSRCEEFAFLGKKLIFINCLVEMCSKVITHMSNSWEDILLRISEKLKKLDEMLPSDSSVEDEFLIAFVCGTTSPELQSFLLHDLTLKGLKALGTSVNTCYKDIEDLAHNKLEMYCHSLISCFAELRGMSRWYDRYGILGVSEDLVSNCISALGSFMLKIREVIQVINSDLKNFRAFFRWVTGLVLRLSDEPAQRTFKEFSQEHYARILYFLQTHLKKSDNELHFQLERVGQYLKDEKIKLELNYSKNPWFNFMVESADLKDSPLLIHPEKDGSLLSTFSAFKSMSAALYNCIVDTISKSFEGDHGINLFRKENDHKSDCCASIYQQPTKNNGFSITFLSCSCGITCFNRFITGQPSAQKLVLNAHKPPFNRLGMVHDIFIKDVAYFDEESIIMLLHGFDAESKKTIELLLQVSTTAFVSEKIWERDDNVEDLSDFVINQGIYKMRALDASDSAYLSASGARKVASVLSRNRRRVSVFDIAGEEEEDENETSHMIDDEETMN